MNAGIQERMSSKCLESEDFSPVKTEHMKELWRKEKFERNKKKEIKERLDRSL